jgi:lipoprotein NlpI
LALANDNARALYYMGLVERRAGNSEAEIADFKKVVAQYPMSRDARRELGKSYYRENNAEGAIEQFEALQVLDPDDVTAHYNLSILYGRMGRDKESAEQQAMFKTKKVDPGAPTYSFDFLMKHPEISTESVPWHMHTDLSPEFDATAPKRDSVAPAAAPAQTGAPTHTSGTGGAHQ